MKRLLICGSCILSVAAVAVAVVMAVGVEFWQCEKQSHWREALCQ